MASLQPMHLCGQKDKIRVELFQPTLRCCFSTVINKDVEGGEFQQTKKKSVVLRNFKYQIQKTSIAKVEVGLACIKSNVIQIG